MCPIKPDVGFLPKNVSPAVNFALAKETKVLKPVPSFEAKTPVQTIAVTGHEARPLAVPIP
jgi:hypothetical protein